MRLHFRQARTMRMLRPSRRVASAANLGSNKRRQRGTCSCKAYYVVSSILFMFIEKAHIATCLNLQSVHITMHLVPSTLVFRNF